MEMKRKIHFLVSIKAKGSRYGIYVWITCMDTCLGLCMESMDLLVRKPS